MTPSRVREFCFLLCLFCHIGSSLGAEAPSSGLNQFMSTVISWNPSLKAARARVEEYQTEKIVSGAYLGPSVQTGFRYYPGDYDEYGFGSRYRANITVSQSLYRDFRRRAYSRKEGDVQIELARNSITQANQDIIRSAAHAYLETAMSMVRMEHYRKMVRCASANLALYQKRRDEREARMLDSISAENALLEAELMLQEAEQEYTVRLDVLNSWLPENSRTPGIKAEWIISSFENDKNLVDKMIQSHPLIREYDRKIDLADVRLNLDKASQTDVQMSVGYNRIGRERFLDSDSWALRVWTDFPLLFTRQSHAQTAKNETVVRQLRLAKEESARMLREQIARAALLCSGLQERKILLDRNRKLAGERFRVAEAAIRIGRDGERYLYNDLLAERFKAEQDVVESELKLALWKYELSMRYIDLLWTAGALPQDGVFRTESQTVAFRKAMWVYDKQIFSNPDERTGILNFCKENDIDVLAVSIGGSEDSESLFQNGDAYADFFLAARNEGIHIHALVGDASWCRKERYNEIIRRMESLSDFYQKKFRFDGVHFDIEPQALPEWDTPAQRSELVERYPSLLDELAKLCKKSMSGVAIAADVPAWFENQRNESWTQDDNLLTRVFECVDEVFVMDYYAEAETIIEKAKEELVQSRIHKKPVWIGLKVKPDQTSKQSDSFSGRNKEYVDQIMHEIYVSLNDWFPELQGFSIFDYTGFRSMRK